uniref:Cytochrome c oxidase subunit 3 n=1 Tax=Scydmaeninae sp. BMNH 1274313 TaxID=1796549 RepID=A0A126TFC9_9COLE|nr:cytochrome c oxidase subunit III [Scydmaeninae sp. BMNH 1274313]
MNKNHPFHLVNESPWPLLSALSSMSMMMGLIKLFYKMNMNLFIISMITTCLIMVQWWRDIIRESTFQGHHTSMVMMMMKWGMILFITSEILFFLSFFWMFFHSSLSPDISIGLAWPPKGIYTFNPLQIPLLNTMILLSSGFSVTWSHHSMMINNFKQSMWSLLLTLSLGLYFTLLQMIEYYEASFNISDSIYGSSFFLTTGFHGLHVIIGSSFLIICFLRLLNNHFSQIHHFGFEAASWYWHFVDIIWLFLYFSIYWWGN